MTPADLAARLEPWLARHRRPAWRPVVTAGDGPPAASKFCGTPWTGPGAPWPSCGACGGSMQPFLQLDLADLPAELGGTFGAGLLQLFYCIRDDCQSRGGWAPFDGVNLARVVHLRDLPAGPQLFYRVPVGAGGGGEWETFDSPDVGRGDPEIPAAAAPPPGAIDEADEFPAKRIVGWERFDDLPEEGEHEELGLSVYYGAKSGENALQCPEFGITLDGLSDEVLDSLRPASGDKLGGWPYWVQHVEYPACPRCGQRMRLVFQVDSEDNVPFLFGDAGCGHVTQCPTHLDVVAFGWACC